MYQYIYLSFNIWNLTALTVVKNVTDRFEVTEVNTNTTKVRNLKKTFENGLKREL